MRRRADRNHTAIVIDLAIAVGLIGLGRRVLKAVPRGTDGRGKWLFVSAVGIVSLLGILVIQMNGGQRVEWQPRAQANHAPALPADLKDMVSRVEALVASYQKADAEITETRWARTAAKREPRQLRLLDREDLREYLVKQRAVLDAIDKMLQFLAEPRLVNDFKRVWTYAESQGLTAGRERPDINPAPWHLLREVYGSVYEMNKLVDENWEEWRSREAATPEAEQKPWQRETKRLAAKAAAAQKQLAEMPDSPAGAQ